MAQSHADPSSDTAHIMRWLTENCFGDTYRRGSLVLAIGATGNIPDAVGDVDNQSLADEPESVRAQLEAVRG